MSNARILSSAGAEPVLLKWFRWLNGSWASKIKKKTQQFSHKHSSVTKLHHREKKSTWMWKRCFITFFLTACTAALHFRFHTCWSKHVFHPLSPRQQSVFRVGHVTRIHIPWIGICCWEVQTNFDLLCLQHLHSLTHSNMNPPPPPIAGKAKWLATIVQQNWIECMFLNVRIDVFSVKSCWKRLFVLCCQLVVGGLSTTQK